jgi:hypothetical protein
MPDQTLAMTAILSRLEQVEKENRRMKQVALGVTVVACSVFMMGQARPNPNKIIEAENFVVKDASGKVRAVFGMNYSDQKGASLILGSDGSYGGTGAEKYVVRIHGGDRAWLNMGSADGAEAINGVVSPDFASDLTVYDKDGYKTDIGITDLVTPRTGVKHHTSASSIVMSSKEKTVLWSAP